MWLHFKNSLLSSVKSHTPSKQSSAKDSPPWLNRELKRMQKKKLRLYHQTKKYNNWSNYRAFQRDCRRAFRRPEYNYLNKTIKYGIDHRNTKPFWKYIKSKKRDNIGVSPLFLNVREVESRNTSDSIFIGFLQNLILPGYRASLPNKFKSPLKHIVIEEKGVLKLHQILNISEATGPDNIHNRVFKE